jgi:outer membrane autotransporter protein
MNRIYHSFWNATLGTWVAAPETARTGSTSRSRTRLALSSPPAHLPAWKPLAAALAMGLMSMGAAAYSPPNIDVAAGVSETMTDLTYPDHEFAGGTIAATGTLNVTSGYTLINAYGTLNNSGTLNNHGALNNISTLINFGTFNNHIDSQLTNEGGNELRNKGTLTNDGTLTNSDGQLVNDAFSTLHNNGTLTNHASNQLDNYGTLNNHTGATLMNTGGMLSNYHTLHNSGTLTNNGSLSNANDLQASPGSGLFNIGTLINNGVLYNGTTGNASSVLRNEGTLTNNGSLVNYAALDNTGTLTINDILTNHGLLTNGGTLHLSNAMQGYSGLANTGTLLNSPSGVLNIDSGSWLHNNGTLTTEGTISNAGTLKNNATGTVSVGTGGTSGTLVGNVVNDGALVFNRSDAAVYSGAISGTGTLQKDGAGILVLNGNSSSFSGSTSVGQGTLLLNSTAKLGGDLTVASGATLAGTGSMGGTATIASGGTITTGLMTAASFPYGTLRVLGDLVMQSGSTYLVQTDPNSDASSLIKVAGQATLAGSAVHVGVQSNAATDYQVGKTYTILEASQIVGTFDSATSNYAYLDATLGYTSHEVTLQLQRKGSSTGGGDMGFAELAETRNQSSVANAISSLSSSSALYQFVEKLPAGTPAAVLASLSGDVQASVGSSLVGLGAYAPSVSGQHLRNNMTAGFRAGAPVAQSDGPLPASAWPSSKALPAWAEVVGHWQRYDSDGNAAQLKQRTTGLFLGMDQEVGTSGWRLGGSLGYTQADGKVADRSSESDVNSYSAAVYGGKSFGTGTGPRINVLGGLAYTWHDIETTRRVSSLGQTLKADYSAHTAQLFAEVGYAIGQYDKVGFEPFAGVSLGQQRTGSFQEHGGFAALQGRSSTDDLASTTLGVRVHSDFQLAGKEGRLRATVGWRHAFGDVTAKKTMAFEGGQNFTVTGTPLARNTAVLGLEADVVLSRSAALVLGYQGEMGSGQRDHSVNAKLRWAF